MDEWLSNSDFWSRYSASAEVIGGFATGLGILIGGVSILLIWLQTAHGARVSREIAAFEAHKDYIRLCIDNPHISSSFMMKSHLNIENFDRILADCTVDSERALWFFSYVLFAMEQLILTNIHWFKMDSAWLATVEDQLGYHSDLLKVVWPEWRPHYSKTMDNVVRAVISRAGTADSIALT